MEHIDYFKLQAKNLLKDYKTRFFGELENHYSYKPQYFDIVQIFSDFGLPDEKEDFSFTLMNAQHIISRISGFSKWNDLSTANESELQFAHRQLDKSIYKIKSAKQETVKIESREPKEKLLPAPKNLYAFIMPNLLGSDVTFSFDAVEYAQSYLVYSSMTNDISTARPLAAGNFSPIKYSYRRQQTDQFFWVRAFDGTEYGEWSMIANKNR